MQAAIRPYTDADFAAVCRIYLEAKADELLFEPGTIEITPLERDARILAAFRQSNVLVFEDCRVMGFAATNDGQLRALFVAREARGRGVGSALLSAVLDNAAAGLQLNVAKSNLAALAFYEAFGFTATGECLNAYAGREIAYVTMRTAAPDFQTDS